MIQVTKEIVDKLVEHDYQFMYTYPYPEPITPKINEVLKWLREEKNIDIEIHAVTDMLGNKAYSPYICTYTTFKLYDDDKVIRYRQKKFNTLKPLPHEVIPAHSNFLEWESAAIDGIEYVLDNLI